MTNTLLKLICPICRQFLAIKSIEENMTCKCGFKAGHIETIPVLRQTNEDEKIDYRTTGSLPSIDTSTLGIEFISDALSGGGLVLELGAGDDACVRDNLIKTDAFIYSNNLNYVVDAHAMPFDDNTFDFVYSLAVFEHLHSPWLAAKEIFRVLKPGGKVFVLTAFMQHVHGYPSHYFNMTTMGLERIFSDFEIKSCQPSFHCPLEQIAYILADLNEMAQRLPENQSANLLSQSIKYFCESLPKVQDDLIKLEANFESFSRIAPGIEIVAMKPITMASSK